MSRNSKHIASFARVPLHNGIDLSKGYAAVPIHTPQEVIVHEDEDL